MKRGIEETEVENLQRVDVGQEKRTSKTRTACHLFKEIQVSDRETIVRKFNTCQFRNYFQVWAKSMITQTYFSKRRSKNCFEKLKKK